MNRVGFLIIGIFLFTGCYTQFATMDRLGANQYVPPDSLMSNDSGKVVIRDTLKVNNNQVCYWTRDAFGRPELRCDDSYYGRDWYRYNNYPWWNSSSSYYYGDYNSYGWDEPCPAYYYYDYSCGACRYYSNYSGGHKDWWWNSGSGSGSGSYSGSGSSASTIPARSRNTRTEGIPTASERYNPSSSGLSKGQGIAPSSNSGTGISESQPVAPAQRVRNMRTEGIPTPSEISVTPNVGPAVGDLNKQIEADRAQQAPPQPSSPPVQSAPQNTRDNSQPQQQDAAPQQRDRSNSDNSSGSNNRDRRNSRGW